MRAKRILATMLALCMALAPLSTATSAITIGPPAIGLGADVLGTGANTGDAQVVQYGGMNWCVIAYDGEDGAGDPIQYTPPNAASPADLYPEGTVTLLVKDTPKYGNYNTQGANCDYETSLLKASIDGNGGALSSLSAAEQAAIVARTLAGGGVTYGDASYDDNLVSGSSVDNVLLWALSAAEAAAVSSDIKSGFFWDWWLRSPGVNIENAAVVVSGNVNRVGNKVSEGPFNDIRFACNLDLDAVLFTSAAVDGKVGDAALTAVSEYNGNNWKLTLLDDGTFTGLDGHEDFSASFDSDVGDVWTVKYSGASTGATEYISAVIVNSAGEITYYGRLEAAAADPGTGVNTLDIDLSGIMNDGDKLYVFNEQCNGNNKTDFASALQEIVKTVKEATPTATFTATGADTGMLSGLVDGGHYTVSGAATADFTLAGATTYQLSGVSEGTLSLVKKGNGTTTLDSDPQTLQTNIAQPDDDDPLQSLVTELESGGSLTSIEMAHLIREGEPLTVDAGDGVKVAFDAEALQSIAGQTTRSITFNLEKVSSGDEDSGKTTYLLTISANGEPIHDFDGKITLTLPDAADEGEARVAAIRNGDGGTRFVVSSEPFPYQDVPEDSYYYDAVDWAELLDITAGTGEGTFDPAASCTRAEMVTFLWRAAGCPAPETTESPFSDIAGEEAYYDQAVLWAAESGIVFGHDGLFDPDGIVDRAQAVTFLYRAFGSPACAAGADGSFPDVDADAYYRDAVQWAAENGITFGTDDGTFSPDDDCVRAQIVTFLYRAYAE